jgi:hypothetical protein
LRVLRSQSAGIGERLKFGVPALEVTAELLIEHTGSNLQQSMCAVRCPPHLLLLDKPLADYLIDGGLDKSGCNRLAVPMTIGVVWDRRHIGPMVPGVRYPRRAYLHCFP